MVFSSPIFLFLFLPLVLAVYYLLFQPHLYSKGVDTRRLIITLRNLFILVVSLLFYFWGETWFVLVMLASTTIDYICGHLIGTSGNDRFRKAALTLSITANLSSYRLRTSYYHRSRSRCSARSA